MEPDDTKSKPTTPKNPSDSAANVIRQKIDALYASEPDTKEELVDAADIKGRRTKHQAFMYQLSTSGKSLAEIQTAWHNYYVSLPDKEKHAVWQEFYEAHGKAPHLRTQAHPKPTTSEHPHATPHAKHPQPKSKPSAPRSVADIKGQILHKVGARRKISKKHHFQSLLFGLGTGVIVMIILLFSFFNERFITPFITPSRSVSSTPIVIDPTSTAAEPGTKVIIPKINVETPVVYDQPSIDDKDIQASLEQGVVHYATTPNPGEQGNVAIVGHSSGNIFNKGKYKFAFMLLNSMSVGDTFSLTKDGKRYVYKVYEKKIVKPTDVSVLGSADRPATATLITCDPPGTSVNRLVVIGEQISPDPATNGVSTAQAANQQPATVPGNSPSLWSRIVGLFSS
jgi:LPXTG-site transpeptidase (sortase) family protein